jgi:hypothetical protein
MLHLTHNKTSDHPDSFGVNGFFQLPVVQQKKKKKCCKKYKKGKRCKKCPKKGL